jgi:hypothetical protein
LHIVYQSADLDATSFANLKALLSPDLAESGHLLPDHPRKRGIFEKSDKRWSRARALVSSLVVSSDTVPELLQNVMTRCEAIVPQARLNLAPSVWHAWRKEIKAISYQLGYLMAWRNENPTGEPAHSLKLLGSLLGRKNDLAVLKERIVGLEDSFIEPTMLPQLYEAIASLDHSMVQQSLDLVHCICQPENVRLVEQLASDIHEADC